MSRASDVRDAVLDELQTRMTGQTVEVFIVPNYTREELESGPRIVVRSGGRDLSIDQGPDTRNVLVEVGVVGVSPRRTGEDRQEEIDACDTFDALMETIIAYWTPNGPLSTARYAMAEHRFIDITQVIQFDPQKMYTDGIWLSMIRLTYQDSVDE